MGLTQGYYNVNKIKDIYCDYCCTVKDIAMALMASNVSYFKTNFSYNNLNEQTDIFYHSYYLAWLA